jgi:hypothetical protein
MQDPHQASVGRTGVAERAARERAAPELATPELATPTVAVSTLATRARTRATLLIATVVSLQFLVSSRLLCPPRALVERGIPRIACPPSLWPFIDYPMFSAPHPRGETLAWVEARILSASGELTSSSAREVQRAHPEETWEQAYARAEERLRAEIEPGLAARALRLVLERHRVVLQEQGLVPCDDYPLGAGGVRR